MVALYSILGFKINTNFIFIFFEFYDLTGTLDCVVAIKNYKQRQEVAKTIIGKNNRDMEHFISNNYTNKNKTKHYISTKNKWIYYFKLRWKRHKYV